MSFGPMQMLIVGFDENNFRGEILPELRKLREHDIVRLVDLLLVSKDLDGTVATIETSDLTPEEASQLGALAGALAGVDDDDAPAVELPPLQDDAWFVADAIPPGKTAAIAILEHRWAIPLRDAIERAGGQALADEWLHPSDLLDLGRLAAPSAG